MEGKPAKFKRWAKENFGKLEERVKHWEETFEHFELKRRVAFFWKKKRRKRRRHLGNGRRLLGIVRLFWPKKPWHMEGKRRQVHKVLSQMGTRQNLNKYLHW